LFAKSLTRECRYTFRDPRFGTAIASKNEYDDACRVALNGDLSETQGCNCTVASRGRQCIEGELKGVARNKVFNKNRSTDWYHSIHGTRIEPSVA
jgi:hypothetical protein